MIIKFYSLWPYVVGIFLIYVFFRKQQNKLAKEILWASFRTTIQLILLAFALQ